MILSIIEQSLIVLPLVMGAYLTLSLLKLPDFSIESAYLFGAVAAFVAKGLPLPLILLSSVGGGMVVGFVVAFLNQYLRLPFLLAAIITNGLFHGLTQYALGTSVASFHPNIGINELTLLLSVAAGIILILSFILRSQLGYSFAIYGNNPAFFANNKLSERYVVFSGIILGHALAGISGFLFAQSNGFVDLTMNFGILLLCLTALIIGKLCIKDHRPNIVIPLLGIFAYFIIQQLLLRTGLNLKYFNAFQALCVLTILFLGHRKKSVTIDHLGV